jgi:hypothetical protein
LHVCAPRAAVEIYREQPAGVIGEERIDPDDLAPLKVGQQLTVVERHERLIGHSPQRTLGLLPRITVFSSDPITRIPHPWIARRPRSRGST